MELAAIAENLPKTLTIVILGFVVVEWMVLTLVDKVSYQKESWVNVISAALAFLPQFLISKIVLLVVMFWAYEHRIFSIGLEWYYWGIAWLLYDFNFWFVHFLSHKVRLLWCLHNVHHSAKEMKLSVGFRGSVFDVFLIPHTFLWMPFLGFHPFLVLIVDAIGKLYGLAVHINEHIAPDKKRRWFEWILITPSAHRVHHSTNHVYLDTNYGETFAIWDRLFNTYQQEISEEKPVYGVMKEVDSGNLYEVQTNEFVGLWRDIRAANSLVDKVKYIIMPPGWNHNGNSVLADELRKAALSKMEKA